MILNLTHQKAFKGKDAIREAYRKEFSGVGLKKNLKNASLDLIPGGSLIRGYKMVKENYKPTIEAASAYYDKTKTKIKNKMKSVFKKPAAKLGGQVEMTLDDHESVDPSSQVRLDESDREGSGPLRKSMSFDSGMSETKSSSDRDAPGQHSTFERGALQRSVSSIRK